VLLAAPDRVLRAGGGRDTPVVRAAVRVLGARHLAEAFVLARARGGRQLRRIVEIDLIHAASMLGLAVASPAMRRDALLSAASACALVTLSVAER
jgi:hypothetical protein